ncbi:MAG: ROK family protein [Pirellulaceae bacterium]
MAATADKDCWVGFDLGGTKMLAVVFDGRFKPLGRQRKKTKGYEGAESGLRRIVSTIEEALEKADVDVKRLAGIGVGCPGPVDMDRGIVLGTPNLSWHDVPVKKALQEKFGCQVAVVNDVDAGVYAEYRFGVARSKHCAVGVFPGTGIGGGCVYQGKIFRGKNCSCMEIGHIPVVPNGRLCGCGQHGCLEAEASRLSIAAAAAKAAYRGEAPHLLELAGTDLADIKSGVLAESIKRGDKTVERIVRHAAGTIGTAVAAVVNLLLPDIVILGGGLVEAMPDLFVNGVRESANARVMPAFVDSFQVAAAELADDASVTGAAAWAEHIVGSNEDTGKGNA